MVNRSLVQVRALGLTVAVVAAGWSLWLCRPAGPALGDRPDSMVVAAAAWLAWLLGGYLVVAAALVAADRLRGGLGVISIITQRLVPRTLRRLVEIAVGLSVTAAGAGAPAVAFADGPPQPAPRAPVVASTDDLDWPGLPPVVTAAPLRSPAPPTLSAPTQPVLPPVAPSAAGDIVVVEPGDSLWTIAAAHLPTTATAGQVATAWPAWWAANRAVIGPDPHLIHPGERLRAPTLDQWSPR